MLLLALACGSFAQSPPQPPGGGSTNDPPTPEQLEAMWQAYLAQLATNRAAIEPWLIGTLDLTEPPPEPESPDAVLQQKLQLLMGELTVAQQQSGIVQQPVELEGELRGVSTGVPGGQHVLDLDDGLADADTISTDELWPGGRTGLNLTGTNTFIGHWEAGGIPMLAHQEYTTRVTVQDGTTTVSAHASQVASVLAASGNFVAYISGTPYTNGARGMSPAARVFAYDSRTNIQEMAQLFSTNGQARVSNHSYSLSSGWLYSGGTWYWFGDTNVSQTADWKFGAYTAEPANIDWLVWTAERHLPVWTPGNSRGEGPTSQPVVHRLYINDTNMPWITNVVRDLDGDAGGYDSIHPQGNAKNALTVAAVWGITGGYNGPASVVEPYFSPYGPTDDGRIKPDVVAQGVYVLMATSGSTVTNYVFNHGTSFAAPGVSGSLNLLAQLREQLHPDWRGLRASTLKAMVIHTADEAGASPGPDFRFGWGLMNTERAANLLRQNATNGWKTFIKEALLPSGGRIECPFTVTAGQDLKFSIVWTDPPGAVQSASLDNPTSRLVNDVDLRVIAPNGTTNFPYVLNPDLTNQTVEARSAAATQGDNTRDNAEQVVITNAAAGTYTLLVTHKGTLYNQQAQWVSILASGVQGQAKPALTLGTPLLTGTNRVTLTWPSVVGQLYQIDYRLSLATNVSWTTVPGELSAIRTNTAAELVLGSGVTNIFFRVKEVE